MSGIMVAVSSLLPTVSYLNGLYNTTLGVELSPIDVATQTSYGGPLTLTYQWIGYYRPASSSAIQLGAICNYTEYYRYIDSGGSVPYNWSGGGNSTCYIWTGNIAKSGWSGANYTALIQNGTGGANFTATANSPVPIRIQWSTDLPYQFVNNPGSFNDYILFAQSNFTFTIAGTSSISGRIFYNSLTNGF
jgi:hypothetical protein